jgi:hypothetical protein
MLSVPRGGPAAQDTLVRRARARTQVASHLERCKPGDRSATCSSRALARKRGLARLADNRPAFAIDRWVKLSVISRITHRRKQFVPNEVDMWIIRAFQGDVDSGLGGLRQGRITGTPGAATARSMGTRITGPEIKHRAQ